MDSIDFGIYLLFILFGISILGLVAMEVFNLVKDPKMLIRAGMLAVGLIALFFISYAVSSGAVTTKYIALGVDEGSSRLIGAGLIMLYIFLAVSFIGIVISELVKILK